MENNENQKAPEPLDDEALDAVTGGKRTFQERPQATCPKCFQPKERLQIYHDPKDPTKRESMCADCARDLGYV